MSGCRWASFLLETLLESLGHWLKTGLCLWSTEPPVVKLTSNAHFQKVPQYLFTPLCQDTLRVELHTFQGGQGLVPHAHDNIVFRPGGQLQNIRDRFGQNQRVVAGRRERIFHACENRFSIMEDRRGLAVPVSYTHLRAHETRHDLVCR